jgi:hypothetical protein
MMPMDWAPWMRVGAMTCSVRAPPYHRQSIASIISEAKLALVRSTVTSTLLGTASTRKSWRRSARLSSTASAPALRSNCARSASDIRCPLGSVKGRMASSADSM